MRRSMLDLRRLALMLPAVLVLLGLPSAGRSQGNGDAERKSIASLADFVSSASPGATDHLLAQAGFGPAQIADLPRWNSYSPHRKLEVAILSAQAHSPENGELFLALLAHRLSRNYPSAAEEPPLKPHLTSPEPTSPIAFRNPGMFGRLGAAPNAHTQRFIRTIASYAGSRGPLTADLLMAAAGIPDHIAYESLRRFSSPEQALSDALGRMPRNLHDVVLYEWAAETTRKYPSAAEEQIIREVLRNQPGSAAVAATAPKNPQPPGPERPWDGLDRGPPLGDGDDPQPGRPQGPRPGAPKGPGDLSGGFGGGEGIRGSERSPSYGVPSSAGERFNQLMARRDDTSFNSMTQGDMALRLGGVVFGNTVSDIGVEQPQTVVLGKEVQVLSRSGRRYVLLGADSSEACLAARVASTQNYSMAGITDNVEGRFNVLLHPQLVHSAIGRDMVLIDALPINMSTTLPTLKWTSGADRDRIQRLLQDMETKDYDKTWQIVDVPMRIGLDLGQVIVQPQPLPKEVTLRSVYIEMRPVTRVGRAGTGFNLAWAGRFREELATLGTLYPPFSTANRFARILAVMRWVQMHQGQLPTTCQAGSSVLTPDAIAVTPTRIETIAPFDVAEERCRVAGYLKGSADKQALGLACVVFNGCPNVMDRNFSKCVVDRLIARCQTELGPSGDQDSLQSCVRKGQLLVMFQWLLNPLRRPP